MKQIALVVLMLTVLICPISAVADPYMKIGLTSIHLGDTDGYDFNEHNFGLGIGNDYEQKEFVGMLIRPSASVIVYRDSYDCDSWNLQGRFQTPITNRLQLGSAINLAHKCFNEKKQLETKLVPTLTSTFDLGPGWRLTLDGLPPLGEVNPFGFVGFSIEARF